MVGAAGRPATAARRTARISREDLRRPRRIHAQDDRDRDLAARFDRRRSSDLGWRGHARRPDADLVWLPGPRRRGGPSCNPWRTFPSPILGLAKLTGSARTVVSDSLGASASASRRQLHGDGASQTHTRRSDARPHSAGSSDRYAAKNAAMGASSASQNGRRAAVQAHAKSAAREPLHRLLLVAGSTQRSGAAYSLTFTATAASPGKSFVVPSERQNPGRGGMTSFEERVREARDQLAQGPA